MIYIKDGSLMHEHTRLDDCVFCGGWQAESPSHLCPACWVAFGKVAEELFGEDEKATNQLTDLIEQLSIEECEDLAQGIMPVFH